MEQAKEEYYSLNDISHIIKAFLYYLRKRFWWLLLAVAIGVTLGVAFYYRQKPKYEAVSTFILEEKSAGGGGLAGIASQFGFDIGSMSSGGSIFTGDNILNILSSKKVVNKVLLSPVEDSATNNKTLADLYLEFSGLKKSLEKKASIAQVNFSDVKPEMTPIQDSVLNVIYESIIKNNLQTERISKQGTIIKVQVIALDRLFARLMTERLVEEASKLYLDIRIGTAQENIRHMQRRSDSLLILLNQKSYRAAASQPLDINPGIRTANVPVEIATRDKAVLSTLYAEVTKNLEASKMILSQQTPVIQLLDKPSYLLKDNKRSLFFFIIFSASAAVFLYIVFAMFLFFVHSLKTQKAS